LIAYCAIDGRDGRSVERNADVTLPSASTIKVLVSLALWRAANEGRLDPAQRVQVGESPCPGGGGLLESLDARSAPSLAELDLLMLAVSDNAATNVLIERVGLDVINALGVELGLERTELRRLMCDERAIAAGRENTTCARDLARLMLALRGPAARRTLAALAESQHTDLIPRYLPPGSRRVFSKQGDLDGRALHDAALIEEPGRTVALAVLSAPSAAPDGLARLAARAYRMLDGER
jgi:beta-lactamase class A